MIKKTGNLECRNRSIKKIEADQLDRSRAIRTSNDNRSTINQEKTGRSNQKISEEGTANRKRDLHNQRRSSQGKM